MKRILLIENEKFLRELYSGFLVMSRYEVLTAEDGKKGLELLEYFTPDLIILDIKMPVMNGIEFLQFNKGNIKRKNIPVLLLTGVFDMEEINKCLDLGALDYVKKTTHPVELLYKIESILEEKSDGIQDIDELPYYEDLKVRNIRD